MIRAEICGSLITVNSRVNPIVDAFVGASQFDSQRRIPIDLLVRQLRSGPIAALWAAIENAQDAFQERYSGCSGETT